MSIAEFRTAAGGWDLFHCVRDRRRGIQEKRDLLIYEYVEFFRKKTCLR